MKKLLIIGADGQVGKNLLLLAKNKPGLSAIGTCHTAPGPELLPLDITKPQPVRDFILQHRPDTIILCSALTNVERCETYPHEAQLLNIEAVRYVKDAADDIDAKLAFFSSEYVFDGKSGPYGEDAPVNPISVYGRTKLEGERIVETAKAGYLIIRTTVVYSWDPGTFNFVMQLLNKLGKGEGMNVPEDQYSNPTYAPDLAEAVFTLLETGKTGLYNVVGRDRMNRHEFALEACNVFGLNPKLLVPRKTAELGQKAARPLAAGMLTAKLERDIGRKTMSAREGLLAIKKLRAQAIAA